MNIILASASKARASLLRDIGINDFDIFPTDIDEKPLDGEKPSKLALRLSIQKAKRALESINSNALIITADTVVEIGGKDLGKALTEDDIRSFLIKLSGRRHTLYTGLSVSCPKTNIIKSRLVKTIIKLKRLTNEEIDWYASTREGIGNAGGYSINGKFQVFCPNITGQVSNVIGLPLFELKNLLDSFNFRLKDYK